MMDSYDIVQAGAPELSEDQFYRYIEKAYGFFTIEIRQLRDFFGSRLIAKALSFPNETAADIPAVAKRAIERI